jgi:putative peptidoglycan lipid II flippase
MATTMAVGSVSVFQFGFNLQSVPLAVIGMSYSVAAFPTLSTLLAKNRHQEFNRQLLTALRHIIFWSVPITALVIVLRAQIVRVLLGSGAFDWGDTRLTAAALALFVISLLAQSILLLLVRAFYAGGKTVVPLVVSVTASLVSLFLAVYLKGIYHSTPTLQYYIEKTFRLEGVSGTEVLVLIMAFVVGQFVQLIVLMVLSVKIFKLNFRPLLRLSAEALAAALAGGFSAYAALLFIVDGVNQDTFIGISLQGLVAGLMGMAAIILVYRVVKAPELFEIYRSFHSRIFKTDIIAPQPDTL